MPGVCRTNNELRKQVKADVLTLIDYWKTPTKEYAIGTNPWLNRLGLPATHNRDWHERSATHTNDKESLPLRQSLLLTTSILTIIVAPTS